MVFWRSVINEKEKEYWEEQHGDINMIININDYKDKSKKLNMHSYL